MESTFAWQVSHTQVHQLWNLGIDGTGIKVGHLDTGISNKHPALHGKIAQFGRVNEHWEVVVKEPCDINDHGTHLAGLICGVPIEGYHYSMAPGAKLNSVQCHGTGQDLLDTLVGLDWLRSQGIKVICLPMGIKRFNPIMDAFFEALRKDGILVVCPTGNYGSSKVTSPGHSLNCLRVGSINPNGSLSAFSGSSGNRPAQKCKAPDLLLPGANIYSLTSNGEMMSQSGTSQSCAIATGIMALFLQAFPEVHPWQIAEVLINTANELPPNQKEGAVNRTVNLNRAFKTLQTNPTVQLKDQTPPENRFIDTALRRLAHGNNELDCIVVGKRNCSLEQVLAKTKNVKTSRTFSYANTALVKATGRSIAELVQCKEVLMASHCI